jgi:hypothetical protein
MKSVHGASSITNPRLKQRRKEKRLRRVSLDSESSKKKEGLWKILKQIIQNVVPDYKINSTKIKKKELRKMQ